MAEQVSWALTELPERVRARIRALAADVLPVVPRLPAPLRKVATFAPNRRAGLGASAIEAALASDDDFRARVAVQVAEKVPAPLTDLTAVPLDADPAEVAALGWLLRPEDWERVVGEAVARVPLPASPADPDAESERWRRKAEASEQALREARARHRETVSELKDENSVLRRKLNEARIALRDARNAGEQATAEALARAGTAEAAVAAAEAELRRLRAEVERLEGETRADRRTARTDRDEATMRARILLETVVHAAAGLQRELSLPPVTGSPGDRLEEEVAAEGARTSSGAGSLGPTSPALLEHYLAMPRSRLLVDGYNVSKTAWPDSSLEAQRTRLLNGLAPLVARTGAAATVVFDAAATSTRPVVKSPRGVKVLFSPEGVIADDTIRELVAVEPEGRVVVVVSSDRELGRDVRRAGARVVAAEALAGLLARSG